VYVVLSIAASIIVVVMVKARVFWTPSANTQEGFSYQSMYQVMKMLNDDQHKILSRALCLELVVRQGREQASWLEASVAGAVACRARSAKDAKTPNGTDSNRTSCLEGAREKKLF